MHAGSPPIVLVKPKARKRRRKALFSTRKQRLAARMRQEKQRYENLTSTVKTLEFSPERGGLCGPTIRIDRSEDIDNRTFGRAKTRESHLPSLPHLSRICETQVRTVFVKI